MGWAARRRPQRMPAPGRRYNDQIGWARARGNYKVRLLEDLQLAQCDGRAAHLARQLLLGQVQRAPLLPQPIAKGPLPCVRRSHAPASDVGRRLVITSIPV